MRQEREDVQTTAEDRRAAENAKTQKQQSVDLSQFIQDDGQYETPALLVPSPPTRSDYNYLLNYRADQKTNISEKNFGSAEALARAKREYAEYFQK